MSDDDRDYALGGSASTEKIPAPVLSYEPPMPKSYNPPIGLIGCGGITDYHLKAYKAAGFNVVAFADINEENAKKRRDDFYPDGKVFTDYKKVLEIDEIEVVDIATHPPERVQIIEDALKADKHILSQKPFAIDLDVAERMVDLAEQSSKKLAVNQNGRWAPHFAYMRQAVAEGIVGDVFSVHLDVHWDHGWVADTPFNDIPHVILYDFAIHWFDMINCFLGGKKATRVFASNVRSPSQKATPPLLGQALVEFEGAQASALFDADVKFGPEDRTFVAGTEGTLSSVGPNLSVQEVTLSNEKGIAKPDLKGTWFDEGFLGTMSELLTAIEEDRDPYNSARSNLNSLAMCFAACQSADTGEPVVPGTVRRMPGK